MGQVPSVAEHLHPNVSSRSHCFLSLALFFALGVSQGQGVKMGGGTGDPGCSRPWALRLSLLPPLLHLIPKTAKRGSTSSLLYGHVKEDPRACFSVFHLRTFGHRIVQQQEISHHISRTFLSQKTSNQRKRILKKEDLVGGPGFLSFTW